MGKAEEIRVKEEKVRRLMEEQGLGGIVLSSQANFAWITAGGDNHVVTCSEAGVASVVIAPEAKYVATNNIEADRIMREELEGQGFQSIVRPWHQESGLAMAVREAVPGEIGADSGLYDVNISGEIRELRYSLTPEEVERYRVVGERAEEAIRAACLAVRPGMSEWDIQTLLAQEAYSRGLTPTVLLVAADERILQYRHPIPKDNGVERYVMLVLCAKRWGLIISCTRLVHFGKISDELRRKHQAVVHVDAAYYRHTIVGNAIGEVLAAGIGEYERQGFPDEWQFHHQGGPTGYAGREFLAAPGESRQVLPSQPFAWNPSICGTKSEDTIIVTNEGIEVLSAAKDWPVIEVEYDGRVFQRPDILVV